MINFLGVLLCSLIISLPANAQKANGLTRYEVFGVPDEVIKVITAKNQPETYQVNEKLPLCDNEELINYIKNNLLSISQEHNDSIVEYRRKILSSRYMENFSEINIDKFEPSQNYDLAENIVNLKHKNSLTNQDIRICLGKDKYAKQNIYVLTYYHDNQVKIKLIGNKINKDFVFLPQKKQK